MRWLNQQIRWSKSYFREWLFNALWWHKHHLWMTYESIVAGFFPFFVTASVFVSFWSGKIWSILWVLITIQLMGIIKGLVACFLRGDMPHFHVAILLPLHDQFAPGKYYAMLTMNTKDGHERKTHTAQNHNAYILLAGWTLGLLPGLVYTIVVDLKRYAQHRCPENALYLAIGSIVYIMYWVSFWGMWRWTLRHKFTKLDDVRREQIQKENETLQKGNGIVAAV